MAVGLDAGQMSNSMLAAARQIVNNANISQANSSGTWASQSTSNLEQLTGGFLNLGLIDYFLNCERGDASMAGLTWALPVHTIYSGVATAYSGMVDQGQATGLQMRWLPNSEDFDIAEAEWDSTSINELTPTFYDTEWLGDAPSADDDTRTALFGYNQSRRWNPPFGRS